MASTTMRMSLSGADCKVCFQAYDAGWRRPRSLPCGHTFCSICMASIIREKRLTCPGCQAHHSIEMVTQLPVNYELESLLKLQPGQEAEYYHDKAGPISLSDVMCTEHNCDVYLRCTTHKAWICQQCTLRDHPIDKCKIISISEELEVRKESLLMFLNEEYERSVQSLLRVRQSLAQVEDEDKKHEEVIGHMAEIILQHRDEQGHLEVQREALEQSIEDLKDKTWVLDQAVLNLQDALSVQQIVASCQEAQANLAYIKDFADVSNIEQSSMDAILHSYKIRATTSMGLHAMHGTSSNDNNEPEKPTTSDQNEVDKNQDPQKQENDDDTGINQVDYTPTLERSSWQMMPHYSNSSSHVHEASESTAERFGRIWDMPRCPSLEPPMPQPRHESITADCKNITSNHSGKSDGNHEPSQKEEENIASLYEKLWNIPKYTQQYASPNTQNDISYSSRDQMHDTGWKGSTYSRELPEKENGILQRFDEIWGLPRSSSIVSLNNTDELENETTQENSSECHNYAMSTSKPDVPTGKSGNYEMSPTKPVAMSPNKPVAMSPIKPVAMSPIKPVATSLIKPIAMNPTKPVAMSPTKPVAMSPTKPVAMSPTKPVATSPTKPIVVPVYPSNESRDHSSNNDCHNLSSSIYMDIAERLSPTITFNQKSTTESRDSNNLSPSCFIPDRLPKNSQDVIKYPYSDSNNVNNVSRQVGNSPLHSPTTSINDFENMWKNSQQTEVTTPDKEDSHSSPFQKLWKKSNLSESNTCSEENTPLRAPIKLQKSPTVKQVKKYLQNTPSTEHQQEKSRKDKSKELDSNNTPESNDSDDFRRISFSEVVDYSTGYQSGEGQLTDQNSHGYHSNLPFIEEEQENYDSNSEVEPKHENPWKLSKFTSCVTL